jgi:hypothetical protein
MSLAFVVTPYEQMAQTGPPTLSSCAPINFRLATTGSADYNHSNIQPQTQRLRGTV